MASLFMPPPKPPKQKAPRPDPEKGKAEINRARLRAGGSSYGSTIVGSAGDALKTSTGA